MSVTQFIGFVRIANNNHTSSPSNIPSAREDQSSRHAVVLARATQTFGEHVIALERYGDIRHIRWMRLWMYVVYFTGGLVTAVWG